MKPVSELRFVVIGSGASGTGYTHLLLKNCGIKTGHEEVFSPHRAEEDPIPDNLLGESSYMGVPYLERHGLPRGVIIHVVRDTLAVLKSLMGRRFPFGGNAFYDQWMYRHMPTLEPLTHEPLTAVIFYYLSWNARCEKLARHRVRVEDLVTVAGTRQLLSALRGVDLPGVDLDGISDEKIATALRQTPTNYNSRARAEVTWEEVLSRPLGANVALMNDRYGYA